jgi:hypothetical protein
MMAALLAGNFIGVVLGSRKNPLPRRKIFNRCEVKIVCLKFHVSGIPQT